MTFARNLLAVLALMIVTPWLLAAPVPTTVAFVQNKESLNDGKLIKARVQFFKAGTYWVAGGYALDFDAQFQFLQGKKSKLKYYELRKVMSEKDNATADLEFPIKTLPLVPKSMVYVAVFHKIEDIPVLEK